MIENSLFVIAASFIFFICSIIRQSIDVVTWSPSLATAGYKFA